MNRKGELAVEALQHRLSPVLKCTKHDLGIARRAESVAQVFELASKLDVVEDLAVIHENEVSIGADHRLRPTFDVDDREPHVHHADVAARVQPKPVRSALVNCSA